MIDFSTTPEQLAFADAVIAALGSRGSDDAQARWNALSDLGALTLLTADGGGDLSDLVALMGAVGVDGCPGPIVATVAAAPHLSAEECEQLEAGQLRVSVAVGGFLPWPDETDIALEVDGDEVWRVSFECDPPAPHTLSREVWAPARIQRVSLLEDGPGFIVAAELGLAAAVLGTASALLEKAAQHARTRVQFGRPIGGFQGVAHQLADGWARCTAAEELVRLVATEHVMGRTSTERSRLARAEACDAALRTAYVVHQVMGGLSFAEETGVGSASTRIRQWSLLLPAGL
ncbi:MAG: acyl-CoA dehydrogenase family protein [bacterium]|nr:acyl-CoA dehydrogenase family protein [bacterium]